MTKLICYDISKNSLRTKMAKHIITAGLDRINKSVYLGTISDSSLTTLEQTLANLIKQKGEPNDSLILISVGKEQVKNMKIYGRNDLDKEALAGEKSTIILMIQLEQ